MKTERVCPRACLLLVLFFSVCHADSGSVAKEAQAAWQNRDRAGQTEKAIALWDKALHEDPNDSQIYIQLTKACGRQVRHTSEAAERTRWADKAREYGTQAVAKNPQSSEAFASYGEALGQWADAHKGVHSLKVVQEAVDALKKAIALDPKNAYAHMLLASFYREAPKMISVGDKQKALEQAKLAVEAGPGYAINHLVLAKVYIDLGKKQEGIDQLQAAVALPAPVDAIPETRADQEAAETLLKKMGVAPACGENGGYCSEQQHS
jgi:tetratricopeptide (TPR) repeat protein